MQHMNEMHDRLIYEFAEHYMEKLFYFCLKKTGNYAEAEDLAQDVALNIVTALNKGTIPTHFSAWVWQIARNRYSVWSTEKRRRNESVTGSDISDCSIEDINVNILDEMISREQLSLLRRELAFIKSNYRDVIVAYYIEDKSVRDIATALSLSENAVKQRLFRARTILKEGMDMAREFGKLSYNPENIGYIFNGMNGENNEPFNFLFRSLSKNIMLAAYRNPSTAEELAMEVGVALPYMEEELSCLVESTLMKKNGDRYETNFFIVSADAQEKIFAHLRGITPELTRSVIDILEFYVNWRNEHCPGWHDGYQSYEDMKWTLLMFEADNLSDRTIKSCRKTDDNFPNLGPWGHTLRPHRGEWDLLGTEIYHGDHPEFVSLYGCVSGPNEKELPEIEYRQFRFKYQNIEEQPSGRLSYTDGEAMVAVANGKSHEVNEAVLKRLESYGHIRKNECGYEPTILVIRKENTKKMPQEVQEKYDELCNKATEIAVRHYLFCRELIYKEIPDFLKEDEFQINHACANIFALRGAILEEALRQEYLLYDKKNDVRSLGASLVL